MKTRLISAVLLLASLAGGRAAPAAPRIAPLGTGPLSSDNVSLVFTIPDTGMVGGRFVGGHYFISTVASAAAFVPGPNSGVHIWDVADPEKPVLAGALPLPHGENEDVDVSYSRKLLLVSMETYVRYFGGAIFAGGFGFPGAGVDFPVHDKLYVISWADPTKPAMLGSLDLPNTVKLKDGSSTEGPGHIANCIADCKQYAYVTGADDGALYVVDLKDAAHPRIAGRITAETNRAGNRTSKSTSGYVHDVNVDPYGRAWATGNGGVAQLDVRNPLKPKALRWVTEKDNARVNQSILHNSLALNKDTLLVTEEDYVQPGCKHDSSPLMDAGEQGSFQTWKIDARKTGAGAMQQLGSWKTEVEAYGAGSNPATIYCSSHWFTFNSHKIVAVGWYDQGVRFLDVSNPRNIRQVGYWLAPLAEASAAYFVPGRSDLVYVADYQRGLDVIEIAGSGASSPTVVAPMRAEWFQPFAASFEPLGPSRRFGWACRVPRF